MRESERPIGCLLYTPYWDQACYTSMCPDLNETCDFWVPGKVLNQMSHTWQDYALYFISCIQS